jgi:hypothetical protein
MALQQRYLGRQCSRAEILSAGHLSRPLHLGHEYLTVAGALPSPQIGSPEALQGSPTFTGERPACSERKISAKLGKLACETLGTAAVKRMERSGNLDSGLCGGDLQGEITAAGLSA